MRSLPKDVAASGSAKEKPPQLAQRARSLTEQSRRVVCRNRTRTGNRIKTSIYACLIKVSPAKAKRLKEKLNKHLCAFASLRESFLCSNSSPRLQPDLDQHRCWSNQKQCVKRCEDNLVETQQHLDQRHDKHNHTLPLLRLHRRLRIRHHEEHEELVHRSRNRRDFRAPRIARDPTTQKRKRKKRGDVNGADVNSLCAIDDDRAEDPDDNQRPFIVSPLHTQGRYRLRREKQQHTNAEVRWIPKMTTLYAQHILRHDRKHAARR